MTPHKQKAQEIIDMFLKHTEQPNDEGLLTAIKCAMIYVYGIMKYVPYIDYKDRSSFDELSATEDQFLSYWQSVLTELNNL